MRKSGSTVQLPPMPKAGATAKQINANTKQVRKAISKKEKEIRAKQAEYPAGEIAERRDGFVLRIADDPLPEGCVPVTDNLTLEDVCHLYLKGNRQYV